MLWKDKKATAYRTMAQATSINLLRSTQTRFWDKVLKWALTTGRFLIILTETIALSAFVYRFTLDRQIVDLADSIEDKQIILSLYKDAEPRYRNLHERLTFVEKTAASEDPRTAMLQRFVSLAQGYVTFQSLVIGEKTATMEITTTSTGALSEFLRGVKSLPEVRSVNISRVENKAANGIVLVTISVELVNGTEETGGQNESN